MPGPKMGPRPEDFDEEIIRQSPTFVKWTQLQEGEKLRYACRDFIRGHDQDEERLMRRIMIARRNNLRDHAILKKARKRKGGGRTSSNNKSAGNAAAVAAASAIATSISTATGDHVSEAGASIPLIDPPPPALDGTMAACITSSDNPEQHHPVVKQEDEDAGVALMDHGTIQEGRIKRRPASTFSDSQVSQEMDVPAVLATRSYRSWLALEEGQEFLYNQKYIKGKEGHDWLLRKNIWRRMRYRRENKKIVQKLIEDNPDIIVNHHPRRRRGETAAAPENGHHHEHQTASEIVDDALSPLETSTSHDNTNDITRSDSQSGPGSENVADNQSNQEPAISTNLANTHETVGSKRASDGEDHSDQPRPTKLLKLEDAEAQTGSNGGTISESDALPSFSQHSHHSTHLDTENNYHTHSDDDEATNAALTAAAAATASGADDLVELSAVEAAVAAAASYVELANQDNQAQEDEQDECDTSTAPVVHNPLDAAALDSAARLAAAAATAQEAQLNEEEQDDALIPDLDESNNAGGAQQGVPV